MNSFIEENLPTLLSALSAILVGLVSASVAFYFKLRGISNQLRWEIRTQFTDPLRTAAHDLTSMIDDILGELAVEEKRKILLHYYKWIYDAEWNGDISEYRYQCNCGAYLAMASLYLTTIYFAKAYIVRSKLPFIKNPGRRSHDLLNLLTQVREGFGGEFGIWDTLQDSLGRYVTNSDGSVITYQEFYERIGDPNQRPAYLPLINFYRYIDRKTETEVPVILHGLRDLVKFIDRNSKHFEY